MPYSIRLPDGRIVGNIPDEIRPEEAKRRIIAAGLAKDEPVVPEEEASAARKKGLLASAVKGAENVIGSTTTAVKSVTGSPEEAALEGLKRQREAEGKYEDTVSLERVKEAYRKSGLLSAAGEALSQVPYALAEQAANIGVSAASGMAGAKVGALAGAPLGPGGAGVGAIVGGLTGAFLPSFAQQYGGNIERQAAEQQREGKKVEIDRGKAAVAGAAQGAAETAATLIPLGRTVVGKVLGPEVEALLKAGKKEAAEQLAKESLSKVVAKGAATTAAVEVPTEVFQSALERAQAGLSLTSNEALAEYGEAAYQAGLISPIGAGGRYIDRSAARQEIAGEAGAADQEYAPVEELKTQRAAAIAEARAKRDAEAEAAFEPEEGEEGAPPPPPSGIITADQLKTLGLKKNFGVHNRILGKDVNDPEQRDYVIANIDDYINNNRGSEESRAALGEYRNILAGMSEAKDAGEAVTETGGVGISVAGEPGAGATPGEPGASVPGGMVPPTEDVEPTDRGARQQPSAVASVQREAPETPEFKSWFGDSKVVDEAGKPLVVYHGTTADITEFDLSHFGKFDNGVAGKGFYFSPDSTVASGYSTADLGASRYENGMHPNVIPVYLTAKNPLVWDYFSEGGKRLQKFRENIGADEFRNWLQRQGYDSVKILGNLDGVENGVQWMVLDPTQIKSAIGNRGTYSPETGDITKTERAPGALGGAVIPELTTAAEKGDTRSALNIIAEHRKTSELDKLVARRLRQMSTLPRIEVAPADQVKGDAQYDPATDTVRIAEGQVDSHTVLHEITHGALHKLILLNMQGKRNDPGYNDLKKLYEHIKKERPDLSKTYGMTDVSEFASEAMSNPEFQDILSKIEYKAQTALQWFGKAVRKLLGIPQREESALTEALIAIDKTIFEGRRVQRTEGADAGVLPVQRRRVQAPPVTPAPAPAGAQPPAAPPPAAPGGVPVPPLPPRQPAPGRPARLVGEPETLSAVGKVSAALGPNKVVGLRTKFADSLAGQENVFSKLYRNRIKDNLGDYNPILLLSRAIDNARFALEALRTGTAVLQPGGLVEVTELKYGDNGRTISYEKDVAESIVKEAKRRGLETKEFHRYVDDLLAAHREYELMNSPLAAEIDFFYTPQEATALEQKYRNDAYVVELSKIMDAIRFSGIDLMVATQRITPEQAKIWKDNLGYVPFNRIDKFDAYAQAMSGMRTQKSGVAAYKQLKPYSGSEAKQVSSPTESFAKTFEWMIKESMKNEASRRALVDLEMLNLAEYVPARAAEDLNKKGAIVDTYVNGVKKSFYVPDPALFAGFVVQEKEVSGVMAGLQSASRILRTGVTIMPPFAIKQIVDDVTRAYVYSGVKNPLPMVTRALMSMPVNWFNEIRGKQSASVRELSKLGIIATYDYSGKTNIKDIFEETGLEKRSLGQKIYRVLEAGAKASDISIRESIYNQVLKETGDKAYAEHQAREIINFSRRGSARIMDVMIRVVPFFNAYARGIDKLAMAASGNNVAQKALGLSTTGAARTMFRNRMMMLTAMGFIYAFLMQDDEEYQKLDDHIRDRNWVLPAGKEFVEKYGFVPAISIPAELAFFFKAIPERVFQMYKLQGTDQERDTMTVAKELFLNGVDIFSSPNVTPQLLKPILENIVNYSFFLGRPLESQMQLNYRPVAREGRGTSEIAKEIAQALDAASVATGIEGLQTSPIKIDNLLRGLFGTTAGTVMAFTDAILNPSRTDRPLHQQLATQLTGASAFMKDGVGTRFISDIYKLEKSVEQAGKTFDLYVKRGEVDMAQDVLQANYGLIATRAYVRELMQTLRALNRMASDIDKATSMTPEERRKALNEFVNVQNELAKEVYRARHMVSEIQQQMDRGLTGIPSKSSTPSKSMPPEPRYPGAETAEVSEEEDEE